MQCLTQIKVNVSLAWSVGGGGGWWLADPFSEIWSGPKLQGLSASLNLCLCVSPSKLREEIDKYGIKIYQYPDNDSDEDEELKRQDKELKVCHIAVSSTRHASQTVPRFFTFAILLPGEGLWLKASIFYPLRMNKDKGFCTVWSVRRL